MRKWRRPRVLISRIFFLPPAFPFTFLPCSMFSLLPSPLSFLHLPALPIPFSPSFPFFLPPSSFPPPLSVVVTEMPPPEVIAASFLPCWQLMFWSIDTTELPQLKKAKQKSQRRRCGYVWQGSCVRAVLKEGICHGGVCRCWCQREYKLCVCMSCIQTWLIGIGRCLPREACKSWGDAELDNLSGLLSGCLNLLLCEMEAILLGPFQRSEILSRSKAHWRAAQGGGQSNEPGVRALGFSPLCCFLGLLSCFKYLLKTSVFSSVEWERWVSQNGMHFSNSKLLFLPTPWYFWLCVFLKKQSLS